MKVLKSTRYNAAARYQTFDERVARIFGIVRLPAAKAIVDVEWVGMRFAFSGGEISDYRIMPPMPPGESSYFDAQPESAG